MSGTHMTYSEEEEPEAAPPKAIVIPTPIPTPIPITQKITPSQIMDWDAIAKYDDINKPSAQPQPQPQQQPIRIQSHKYLQQKPPLEVPTKFVPEAPQRKQKAPTLEKIQERAQETVIRLQQQALLLAKRRFIRFHLDVIGIQDTAWLDNPQQTATTATTAPTAPVTPTPGGQAFQNTKEEFLFKISKNLHWQEISYLKKSLETLLCKTRALAETLKISLRQILSDFDEFLTHATQQLPNTDAMRAAVEKHHELVPPELRDVMVMPGSTGTTLYSQYLGKATKGIPLSDTFFYQAGTAWKRVADEINIVSSTANRTIQEVVWYPNANILYTLRCKQNFVLSKCPQHVFAYHLNLRPCKDELFERYFNKLSCYMYF